MKAAKRLETTIVFLITLTMCSSAFAYRAHGGGRWHHGGARVGLHIGVPLFSSPFYGYSGHRFGYYSYPYSYPSPVTTIVTVPREPIVYIEKDAHNALQSDETPGEGFWHYCREPAGYYPQVASCLGSWQKIPPSSYSR